MDKKFEELEKLGKPLIIWLRKNYNPHTKLIIDGEGIEVVEGILYTPISFEKDFLGEE